MNTDEQSETVPQIENPWDNNSSFDSLRDSPKRLSPLPLLRITNDMPCREAAAFLGVNAGTLQKWRNGDIETGLHYARADRIAVKALGKHPAEVWGSDWWKV